MPRPYTLGSGALGASRDGSRACGALVTKAKPKIVWLEEPGEHNYPAALSYLKLHFERTQAQDVGSPVAGARMSQFKAKDICRSSGLALRGVSSSHIEKDRKKIESGQPLSPLLLVRDPANTRLIVSDGYHRLCAVYS